MEYDIFEEMTDEEIGEWMWENHREEFNGKFFYVLGKRLYPVIERGAIVSWEFD